MRRLITFATIGALALSLTACSQQQAVQTQDQINAMITNTLKNAGATDCNPATLTQILANVPMPPGVTSNQLTIGANAVCSTMFGTTAAPVTATGMSPVFAAVPPSVVVPAPVASPIAPLAK